MQKAWIKLGTQNNPGEWKQRLNLRSPGGLVSTHTYMVDDADVALHAHAAQSAVFCFVCVLYIYIYIHII